MLFGAPKAHSAAAAPVIQTTGKAGSTSRALRARSQPLILPCRSTSVARARNSQTPVFRRVPPLPLNARIWARKRSVSRLLEHRLELIVVLDHQVVRRPLPLRDSLRANGRVVPAVLSKSELQALQATASGCRNQAAIRDLFKVARYHWRGSSSAR
jgi:hypothetical protein